MTETTAMRSPAYWTAHWGIPLLEEIDLDRQKKFATGLTWPGRNRTGLFEWLHEKHGQGLPAVDPQYACGQGWGSYPGKVEGCEIVSPLEFQRPGDVVAAGADARTWVPSGSGPYCCITSFEFGKNHSSGDTERQREYVRKHKFHAFQEWKDVPGRLGALEGQAKWDAITGVYRQIGTYAAVVCSVLHNYVRDQQEIDEICFHIQALKDSGWIILGAHPRDRKAPQGWEQRKLSINPWWVWIRWEWSLVAVRPTLRRA